MCCTVSSHSTCAVPPSPPAPLRAHRLQVGPGQRGQRSPIFPLAPAQCCFYFFPFSPLPVSSIVLLLSICPTAYLQITRGVLHVFVCGVSEVCRLSKIVAAGHCRAGEGWFPARLSCPVDCRAKRARSCFFTCFPHSPACLAVVNCVGWMQMQVSPFGV